MLVTRFSELRDWIARQSWTGMLVSTIVHVLLILLLATWAINPGIGDSNSTLESEFGQIPGLDISDFSATELNFGTPSLVDSANLPIQVSMTPATNLEISPALERSNSVRPSSVAIVEALGPLSEINKTFARTGGMGQVFQETGIEGRSQAKRGDLVGKRGGNAGSEKAVEDALEYFVRHQLPDGGWSLAFNSHPCNGQCANPTDNELDPKRAAATGLVLLSFLGAGYTHREGKYQKEVHDGIYFLINIMRRLPEGGRFTGPIAQYCMYEQGIAALALCEAYQMTNDKQLKNDCQLAINYILYAQHIDGSWGYEPKMPGDLSIAAWQVMALKSAHASGLYLANGNSLKRFDKFLDSQQSDGGAKYGYRSLTPTPSTTAMGLLMRMYRGWPKTDPRLLRGINYFIKYGPSESDVYFNYYATQVLFHQEGNDWLEWNPRLRDFLITTQSKSGHDKGSWFFAEKNGEPYNRIGGRIYCTAMNALTLEVYYRHMPIYGRIQMGDFKL